MIGGNKMRYEMVEAGNYPLKFSNNECSKMKNGLCPFEMSSAELKKRMKELDMSKPFNSNNRSDLRYCYILAKNMKKSYAAEKIDVGKRNGKIVRVNNGRHRLCIGKKLNKKVKAWVELE